VLVGNFILDFNYEMMAKSLRVPDEKFRDKVYKTLQENLSTILKETGEMPATSALAAALIPRYEALLGPLPPTTEVDAELLAEAERCLERMYTDDWLFANDRRRPDVKEIKIREGVYVIQKMVKLPGGLVSVNAVNEAGKLREVHISGDFFIYPMNALEELETALEGAPADLEALTQTIQDFYRREAVETPGITPESLAEVLTA
jgi:lipoate-protein ligase A